MYCGLCQQLSVLYDAGLCRKCHAGQHIPPGDLRNKDLSWGKTCLCFPAHICSWITEKDPVAKATILTSKHKCSYCKHRLYAFCTQDLGPQLCRVCVPYIANFDEKSAFSDLAYKMANTDASVRNIAVFYAPGCRKPQLCENVDEFEMDDATSDDHTVEEVHHIAPDQYSLDVNNDRVQNVSRSSDGSLVSTTDDIAIRDGFVPPSDIQVSSVVDDDDYGCRNYANFFAELGARALSETERIPPLLNQENFRQDTAALVNNRRIQFTPVDDYERRMKQGGGKEHAFMRFYRIHDDHYISREPQLHKISSYDGYVNTQMKIFLYRCGISNPHTKQQYVWLHLWRGPCGKILKCILYDLAKKQIVEFKGTMFYRKYWNFDTSITFDEEAVHEAYVKFCEPFVHQENFDLDQHEAAKAVIAAARKAAIAPKVIAPKVSPRASKKSAKAPTTRSTKTAPIGLPAARLAATEPPIAKVQSKTKRASANKANKKMKADEDWISNYDNDNASYHDVVSSYAPNTFTEHRYTEERLRLELNDKDEEVRRLSRQVRDYEAAMKVAQEPAKGIEEEDSDIRQLRMLIPTSSGQVKILLEQQLESLLKASKQPTRSREEEDAIQQLQTLIPMSSGKVKITLQQQLDDLIKKTPSMPLSTQQQ